MPLIDEETLATDRRSRSPGTWLAVVAAIALIWFLGAFVANQIINANRTAVATVAQATPPVSDTTLRQAVTYSAGKDDKTTVALLSKVKARLLSVGDRHVYYRTAAESYSRLGRHQEAAGMYAQFISMAPDIYRAECRGCHTPSQAFPGPTPAFPESVAAMSGSVLGTSYSDSLKAAGKLEAERKRLRVRADTNPKDIQAHVLLYHVERARGNGDAAQGHVQRMVEYDVKALQGAIPPPPTVPVGGTPTVAPSNGP